MRGIFIRHGQSTGNAGLPSHDLARIELTELGRAQSRRVADEWVEAPTLIVTSPFLRTQQTAAPTVERFPGVPVEVWPIEEFTYLHPARWNGTSSAERLPYVESYWSGADPHYCDGEGAESFNALLRRAEAALTLLAALPDDALVYAFSHGQFIQAVRDLVAAADSDDRERMRRFWRKGEQPAIANVEMVRLARVAGRWQLTAAPPRADQRP
jgi:broad specificity phosphatase PhoE